MVIDLIIDEARNARFGPPYCGWWGGLKSTDVMPFTYRLQRGSYFLDFGSSPEDDQSARLWSFPLISCPIKKGQQMHLCYYDDHYDLTIKRLMDMLAGKDLD